ncbi:MAG: BrnT family toxin [Hyphomicrobiales bacterium]
MGMATSFDPAKRDLTLHHRRLDFARAGEVFAGPTATVVDGRIDYGETRFISAGHLDDRLVVLVWTQRGDVRHIISMRHCHADEEKIWLGRMDRFR